MWSEALNALLTTLRYLAPATLLTLFWGQQSFLFKLLRYIDSAFRSLVFSSEEQKSSLQWLEEAGSVRVESLNTIWRHGWILCKVLDTALPGACEGHPPTRLSLEHAQTVAEQYLNVEPVFTRQELETIETLNKNQEWKLTIYLDRIRDALYKLTAPVSKRNSQRTSPEITQFTLDYAAKGTGLVAAQINNKMHFKIYPTSQQSLDPGEITILIRGPRDTYGMAVIPPILGKAQLIRQKLLGLQTTPSYTENALPLTQGAVYLRSYGKNNMNKTYYIPKVKYDIQIEVDSHQEYARIGYQVKFEGKYEISIITRGQNIIGSPYTMKASRNIIDVLERENSCLENGEEIDIVDIQNDRKIVLKIVDFVTEKMLLRENGTLEKLTEEQAKALMKNDGEIVSGGNKYELSFEHIRKQRRFNEIAKLIVTMNKFCKIFNEVLNDKRKLKKKTDIQIRSNSPQAIPDIVNSTLYENTNKFIINEKEYISTSKASTSYSVSSSSKKSRILYEEDALNAITEVDELSLTDDSLISDSLNHFKSHIDSENTDDSYSIGGISSTSSPSNSNLCQQNYELEKELGAFVSTEYETNNLQNELTQRPTIQVFVAEENTPPPINNNPFIEPEVLIIERPKTPVLKIITGQVKNRDESVYLDPNTEKIRDEILGNEFINPFFLHHQYNESEMQPDFIIGAPVSLPPHYRASSPEPYLLINNRGDQNTADDATSSTYSTPIQTHSPNEEQNVNVSSNTTEFFQSLNATDKSSPDDIDIHPKELPVNLIPNKRDIWDSAYVSIDDSNSSSPENDQILFNNNISKHKLPITEIKSDIDLSKVGPAEREIWQTCEEINSNNVHDSDDHKTKWEAKRPLITPIIEEPEKTISTSKQEIIDTVTVAFAELNSLYNEYYPSLSDNAININNKYNESTHKEKTIVLNETDTSVNSASGLLSDVKRRAKQLEGLISEVQANVTESVSVSHTLHDNQNVELQNNNIKQFGDDSCKNIVLEKKKYWDQRIREIEAKTAETKNMERKTRLSAKHLKHNDSLSKKRGKKIVNNFLSAARTHENLKVQTNSESLDEQINKTYNTCSNNASSTEDPPTDLKLVEKWKKFWDEKLETEKEVLHVSCFGTKSPHSKILNPSPQTPYLKSPSPVKFNDVQLHETFSPSKQEVSEEVFKAFETSPKRFFGTSRKQIISKIDAFLGKTSSIDDSSTKPIGALQDSSLVSSRVSMFHGISQPNNKTQQAQKRSQSLQNVCSQFENSEETQTYLKATMIKSYSLNGHNKTKYMPFPEQKIGNTNNTIKEKRAVLKIAKTYNKTIHGSFQRKSTMPDDMPESNLNVKETVNNFNKNITQDPPVPNSALRKTSFSKSEMDIFNKTSYKPVCDNLEKLQSCEDLPTINVKSFISLYESVSKPSSPTLNAKKYSNTHSIPSSTGDRLINRSQSDAVNIPACFSTPAASIENLSTKTSPENPKPPSRRKRSNASLDKDIIKMNVYLSSSDSTDFDAKRNGRTTTLVSLSDIELEIVEDPSDISPLRPSSPLDYKSRFKSAKEYFQSLEELGESRTEKKLNESEMLLYNSRESLENRPNKRVKKIFKAHSVPSSELSKIWDELLDSKDDEKKPVKISEKFNVDDLFTDIVEGKLSRQGSLRGIPHKKAVLETFRSMENVADSAISPYEISIKQLKDFAEDNKIKNVQTYLTEYPFLPKTEPSKYRSRLDTNASGLISLRELKQSKPRRNSVPDLRINPNFIVNL